LNKKKNTFVDLANKKQFQCIVVHFIRTVDYFGQLLNFLHFSEKTDEQSQSHN